MSKHSIPVNRMVVGVIAIVCLLTALGLWVADQTNDNTVWAGAFMRVGLLLSAFWLALPTRTREAAWVNVSPYTFIGVLLALFVVARLRFQVVPLIIVIAILWLILKPRRSTS